MAPKMKEYFNAETAEKLGNQLGIDGAEYAAWVAPRVGELEILGRVTVFAEGLKDRLPEGYGEAVQGIVARLGPELLEGEGYFNHAFHLWPVSRYIELYGLDEPELSLDAIEALTRAFTGEWAVRPYLERYPELTLARVHEWARSGSHNVRRLASEGIRPRLPWARVHTPFVADPTPIIPVLEQLHADESLFVRTSVANNLNDISRTHPELALETAGRWAASSAPHATWMVERGLRTLIKRGDAGALALAGYGAGEYIAVQDLSFPPRATVGEAATLKVTLANTSAEKQELLAEYRLHFLKKNGQRRPSVFRLGKFTLAPGERLTVEKQHVFRLTSTRTYYPGTQAISVVVNGRESDQLEFELVGQEGP
ncbi:DNA alkylation repair protein [Corynebacterium aquatimens]|uniref:DNA alkylation repair protein n=1 Tax=Corynebacterium TaxID=1716 RepID=UPI001F29C274|nr:MULTISPECIES: DNA alkylation repair protein [Corynebacterium]QYH19957.1 DNA alkylation repair protein [Corynebacterium aquatimens]UIZ92863.1 DNA alkylation repair protein [Corynebacterium sp. CNCTC7651]